MGWAPGYLIKCALAKRAFAEAPTLGLDNQRGTDDNMRVSMGGGGMGTGGMTGGTGGGSRGGMPSQVDPQQPFDWGSALMNAGMIGYGLYSLKGAAGGAGAAGAGGTVAGAGGTVAPAAGAGPAGTGTTAARTAGQFVGRVLPSVGNALSTAGRVALRFSPHAALLALAYGVGKYYNTEFNKAYDQQEQAEKSTKRIETELAIKNRNREILAGKHDWRYKGPEAQKQLADMKARIQRQGGDKTPGLNTQNAASAPASGGGWQTPTGPTYTPGAQQPGANPRRFSQPQGGAPVSPSLSASNPLEKAPAVSTAATMPASMQKGLNLTASPKPGPTQKLPAVPGGGPAIGGATSKPGVTKPKLPKAGLESSESQVA